MEQDSTEQLKLMVAGIRPYMVYRNPKDDKVARAIQEAAAKLTAEGKHLCNPTTFAPLASSSTR